MVDVTSKPATLRKAVAQAIVTVSSPDTIRAIEEQRVPKGNVFEMSKAAGLLGIKKTPDLLPDCHPLPIEFASVHHSISGLEIIIEVEVHTIYKTGVEVEAMHGASVVALTLYDMLKPIDKGITISAIRVLEKRGGKSDFVQKPRDRRALKAAVVVCSDTISKGQKEDKAGIAIVQKLEQSGVTVNAYEIIPDEREQIQNCLIRFHNLEYNLVIYTGGTGLSVRDVTPESITPLLDRRIPGIEEAIRAYGQQRTPYSMLSRSLAGVKENMLVLALPGSTTGAKESMDAVFPHVLHVFGILRGSRHDQL